MAEKNAILMNSLVIIIFSNSMLACYFYFASFCSKPRVIAPVFIPHLLGSVFANLGEDFLPR
ncbi:hypothetical protein B6V88_09360 [Legionella micdadei]|nr:hypothetical protein B6V88_09360 [Legionella micdadei]